MFGEKIKALRISKNLTQEAMASHFNLSAQAISRWEQNSAMPDISLLIPIADYFNVTVDSLLRENEDENHDGIVALLETKIESVSKHGSSQLISGYIKNNSNRKFDLIQLKVRVFDSTGSVVDYVEDSVFDLNTKESKRFSKLWFHSVPFKSFDVIIEGYKLSQ